MAYLFFFFFSFHFFNVIYSLGEGCFDGAHLTLPRSLRP